MRAACRLLIFSTAFVVAACGDRTEVDRVAVEGSIAGVDAESADGSITFLPLSAEDAPAATTAIVDGYYEFDAETGPFPGKHRVVISLKPEGDKLRELQSDSSQSTDRPREYEFEVDVPADSSTTHDFQLK